MTQYTAQFVEYRCVVAKLSAKVSSPSSNSSCNLNKLIGSSISMTSHSSTPETVSSSFQESATFSRASHSQSQSQSLGSGSLVPSLLHDEPPIARGVAALLAPTISMTESKLRSALRSQTALRAQLQRLSDREYALVCILAPCLDLRDAGY